MQDYSPHVVNAGGVPAMLAYLGASAAVEPTAGRTMRKDALLALSNVAGANSGTVAALLDGGAFEDVLGVMRDAGTADAELLVRARARACIQR